MGFYSKGEEKMYTLECCVDSVASAICAQAGGATRIELCSSLMIGGVTPSLSLFEEVKKHVSIPIHVLLRPRYGDFLYSEYEYAVLKREVCEFIEAGADCIVIGCLTKDGKLDATKMQELIAMSKGKPVTLHRAFDMCQDPYEALEQAKKWGIKTILTSGQKNSCIQGMALIQDLIGQAGSGMEILVGAGVNQEVVRKFLNKTDASSFHMSGKKVLNSQMQYRKEGVSMGLPAFSEYEVWQTNEYEIKAVKELLEQKYSEIIEITSTIH